MIRFRRGFGRSASYFCALSDVVLFSQLRVPLSSSSGEATNGGGGSGWRPSHQHGRHPFHTNRVDARKPGGFLDRVRGTIEDGDAWLAAATTSFYSAPNDFASGASGPRQRRVSIASPRSNYPRKRMIPKTARNLRCSAPTWWICSARRTRRRENAPFGLPTPIHRCS